MTAGRFLTDIKSEIERDIIKPMNKVIAEATIGGYKAAKRATPVDTGFLRSNWRMTKNQESRSNPGKGRHPAGHTKGADIYASANGTSTASAVRVANSYDITKHKSIVLTNNVNYAGMIDGKNHMLTIGLNTMKAKLLKLSSI